MHRICYGLRANSYHPPSSHGTTACHFQKTDPSCGDSCKNVSSTRTRCTHSAYNKNKQRHPRELQESGALAARLTPHSVGLNVVDCRKHSSTIVLMIYCSTCRPTPARQHTSIATASTSTHGPKPTSITQMLQYAHENNIRSTIILFLHLSSSVDQLNQTRQTPSAWSVLAVFIRRPPDRTPGEASPAAF